MPSFEDFISAKGHWCTYILALLPKCPRAFIVRLKAQLISLAASKDNFLHSKSQLTSALFHLCVPHFTLHPDSARITLISLDLQNVHILMKIYKFHTAASILMVYFKKACMYGKSQALAKWRKRYAQSLILYIKTAYRTYLHWRINNTIN